MLSDEEKILTKKLRYCEQEYEQNGYLSVGKFEAIKEAANLIEKQSKEIEELKNKDKKWEDKIKAKIKAKIKEMDNIISQNEGIIFNGRYEHLLTLTEARIVKCEMQSLLEKE